LRSMCDDRQAEAHHPICHHHLQELWHCIKAEHKCGLPVGMETRRSELLVITGLHRSGCLFWVLRVLATSTRETKVFLFFTNLIYYLLYYPTFVVDRCFDVQAPGYISTNVLICLSLLRPLSNYHLMHLQCIPH